jgi:hypothetical protein
MKFIDWLYSFPEPSGNKKIEFLRLLIGFLFFEFGLAFLLVLFLKFLRIVVFFP